jgi:4-hydroxybenzoyl-CoA thioesterase
VRLATTLNVIVQWGDCDPADIVFYPNYFRWFDAASRMVLEQILPPKRALLERYGILGFPIVDASARFMRPSSYGDAIEVQSAVEQWNERRFTVLHRGVRGGELLFEGRELRVVGRQHPEHAGRLQSIPIPEEIVAAFRRQAEHGDSELPP